jgi:hypothetical protein
VGARRGVLQDQRRILQARCLRQPARGTLDDAVIDAEGEHHPRGMLGRQAARRLGLPARGDVGRGVAADAEIVERHVDAARAGTRAEPPDPAEAFRVAGAGDETVADGAQPDRAGHSGWMPASRMMRA